MSVRISGFLSGLLLASFAPVAAAVISCSVTVTSVLVIYDPNATLANDTTGSYTVNCSRTSVADAGSQTWSLGVNDGQNSGAGTNRVKSAANKRYDYDTYRTTGTANPWGDTATTRFSGTINFGSGLTGSASGAFEIIMPKQQTVQPASIYSDTLAVTLRDGPATTTFDTKNPTVTVHTDNWCQFLTSPGTVAFTYTSFQKTIATASTNYAIRCTTGLPYTMGLDLTSSSLLGLTYNLALSSSSATGNGLSQPFSVNGTISAGQAGTCPTGSCTGLQTRTLTLTW